MTSVADVTGKPNASNGRRRWRFSIRQLLLFMIVIGAGLALYRELPDLLRKKLYNDPVPLVVTDKSKIHVRQVPYLPGGHFLYRVYLPPDRSYELCIAEATTDDPDPEPMQTHAMGAGREGKVGYGEQPREWRITGYMFQPETEAQLTRLEVKIDVLFKMISTSGKPLSVTFTNPGQRMWIRRPGHDGTQAFNEDDEVVLFREFFKTDGNEDFSGRDEYSAGPGIKVWIRPIKESDSPSA